MATAFDIKHGQIAVELARELKRTYTNDLRLVSRTPRKVNNTHKLVSANLLDAKQTLDAVEGSSIVYFTASLPPDTQRWEALFPTMLKNALDACRAAGASFAYFDNTYMYPQDARLQTEDTSFAPVGRKGKVRAAMASMVLEEPGICRAATTGRPTRRSSRWSARSSNANPAIR